VSAARDALEVLRPGMLATVQDLGRPGLGRFGVSPSGAMDPLALLVANRLVGNPDGAAALELTGPGAELRFVADLTFALAGGDLGAALDGVPLPALTVGTAAAGQRLTFGARVRGARAVVAVAGGLAVPAVLGSAATDLGAGLGGKALARGQRLACGGPAPGAAGDLAAAAAGLAAAYADPFVLRFVLDEDPAVPPTTRADFCARAFILSTRSNRTGYRFEGAPLACAADPERLSEPTAPGAIQLPPDGLPILLMADRNTTGGYPRLGHLATVDRPKAAQLWPGDEVTFHAIGREEAIVLLHAQEVALSGSRSSSPAACGA
jgi:antagonist of KipI